MNEISLSDLLPYLSERGQVELELAMTRYQLAQANRTIEQLAKSAEIPTA